MIIKNKKSNTFLKTGTTLIIIGTLMYPTVSTGSPLYVGISAQQNQYHFDHNNDPFLYEENADLNVGAFIGYELKEFEIKDISYKLSVEGSFHQDKSEATNTQGNNSKSSVPSSNDVLATSLKTQIISLNAIHSFEATENVSLIGISGLSYIDTKYNEVNSSMDHYQSGSDDGYGLNLGIGMSFKIPNIQELSVRTKIVHSFFNDVRPNESIKGINGITSFSIDLKINF